MNGNVVVCRSVLENCNVTSDAISVLCALNRMCYAQDSIISFNVPSVMYFINGIVDDRRYADRIKKGIQNLIDCGVIEALDSHGSNNNVTYFISTNGVYVKDTHFSLITVDEMQSVMTIGGSCLLRYFMLLIATLNNDKHSNNYKCGFYTIDMLSDVSGFSKRTILNYNKLIEDAGLIYIHRFGKAIYNLYDGTISNISNTYGRVADRNKIIVCANEFAKSVHGASGDSNTLHLNTVNSRSVSMRYNNFISGISNGKSYEYDYVVSLRNDCELYNEKYKNSADAKLKDISIFEEYMEGLNNGVERLSS